MKCNININVVVELTDFGKYVLARSESEKLTIYRISNGKYRFRLWELMQIFGRDLYNEMPFVENEIDMDFEIEQ